MHAAHRTVPGQAGNLTVIEGRQWLENALLRAVASDTRQRFETAEEMLLALERGEARPVSPPQRTPLWHRHPAARWQAVALILLVINLLLFYLLLVR